MKRKIALTENQLETISGGSHHHHRHHRHHHHGGRHHESGRAWPALSALNMNMSIIMIVNSTINGNVTFNVGQSAGSA